MAKCPLKSACHGTGSVQTNNERAFGFFGNFVPYCFLVVDGSLICKGKGNKDWLCSAPHGAGRLMSRTQAKKELSMDSYKNEMNGIYSTSVCEETIDEAPMAYKPTEEIVELIKPTVDVIDVIKPIYNFKAKL
jgi:RNA-splicing ligase RtcB